MVTVNVVSLPRPAVGHLAMRTVALGRVLRRLGEAVRRLASFISGLLVVVGRLVDAIFRAV